MQSCSSNNLGEPRFSICMDSQCFVLIRNFVQNVFLYSAFNSILILIENCCLDLILPYMEVVPYHSSSVDL